MQAETHMTVVDLPMEELHADHRFNCRGVVLPQSCMGLADEIKNGGGLYHPIHVRDYSEAKRRETGKKYQIVSGYRRYTACGILKWKTIPSVIHLDMSDIDARIMNLGENLTREDLNIVQEAQAVKQLVDLGETQEAIGKRLGRSRGWAQVRCMLLELPEQIQELAAQDVFTQQQIRDIYGLPTYEAQFEAVRKIKEKGKGVKVKVKSGGTSPYSKKPRTREEIFEMMDHFYEYMDPNFITRVMAWCAGEINAIELLRDFKEYLWDEKAVHYEIPESIMPAMPVRTYASSDGE